MYIIYTVGVYVHVYGSVYISFSKTDTFFSMSLWNMVPECLGLWRGNEGWNVLSGWKGLVEVSFESAGQWNTRRVSTGRGLRWGACGVFGIARAEKSAEKRYIAWGKVRGYSLFLLHLNTWSSQETIPISQEVKLCDHTMTSTSKCSDFIHPQNDLDLVLLFGAHFTGWWEKII